jgi:nucleotide-binding universal stress UspA family protein
MRPLSLATVLVATDLRSSSDSAIDSGHRLAEAAGAMLHVVHVDDVAQSADESMSSRRERAESVRLALQRAGASERRTAVHVRVGHPAEVIRSLAERIEADVIVVGPHRQRAVAEPGHHLGGTARDIGIGAAAPCLVATHSLRLPLERVLVPVDLSATARGASLVGLSWASALRAGGVSGPRTTLGLLHVLTADEDGASMSSFDGELERARRSAGSWAGVEIEGITARGKSGPASAIADCAHERKSDLIVLGTRGIGLDEVRRLGSVSAAVVALAQVPVLLVPPAVWQAHAAEP